jgi:hypothetical protein
MGGRRYSLRASVFLALTAASYRKRLDKPVGPIREIER